MMMTTSTRIATRSMFIKILISLILICSHVHAHQNEQIIIDFDGGDDHQQATTATPTTTLDTPQAVPTGIPAQLIKKVTGWNDTIVAKLLGQIPPRPPHPFVVPITDENYEEVIESEIDSVQPGWGSDQDTVWVISVVASDRPSTLFDDQFDKLASNSSLAIKPIPPKKREDEPDVVQKDPSDQYLFKPQIRFARIDYMASTDFTLTKWLIFKCPVMVVVTKRGSELRFFKTGGAPPSAEHLGEFLREERYLLKPIWNSTFSHGNSGEWVVVLMGRAFQSFHMLTNKVPGWLLMIVTSMLGTSLMQWLHKSPPKTTNTRSTNTPSTRNSKNPPSENLASQELKKELAQAAVQLAQITDQKRGTSSAKTQSTTPQRRK
ncbi:hypothetical protein PGTUg99_034575 [Puccinia graminis f. sp. tritici]|uniref:Thioredoxin domain-containing protein n=1 Tax=Puccinia graminis f. sp. tritici TaxID=56615 RepID=A0A5B0NLW3_PUCGR|nr:hypothetical protein PGTUg99_034575 [Puccinia graminis f. sp. tritici]